MTLRVDVKPDMLNWAMRRAQKDPEKINNIVPVRKWLSGEVTPTYKQLEAFADATYTAVGMLLLDKPPAEHLPIADWRAKDSIEQATANLLDTLFQMQERQDWFISNAIGDNADPLPFVASATLNDNPSKIAEAIQNQFKINLEERAQAPDWESAFRIMMQRVRDGNVLVMTSGIVGSNTNRALDPDEFRGFTLMDPRAPLIFINNKDAKSAQMFTLAHELAHVWLGKGGLDDVRPGDAPTSDVEKWCNAVAARILVPEHDLHVMVNTEQLDIQVDRLTRRYKVSRAVVLRSMENHPAVDEAERRKLLWKEYERTKPQTSGGNWYTTTKSRTGEAFAATVIASALEGRTTYREAYDLLGVATSKAFENLGRDVGVIQ